MYIDHWMKSSRYKWITAMKKISVVNLDKLLDNFSEIEKVSEEIKK